MRPAARSEGLVVRELADELVVYDRHSHQAHCLNGTAALVFRSADGTRTVEDIASALGSGSSASRDDREAAVRQALAALARAGLLAGTAEAPPTRREALRRVGVGAVFLLPAVVSVVAPTPAEALATCVNDCTGKANGTPCATVGSCGTDICCEQVCTDAGGVCP
jgi:PqqD family protein of HPr-rel-A system